MHETGKRRLSAGLVLFVISLATPTFQQQAQPIFYGNPAAFQYQQQFGASNFAPNSAPSVFVPFQSRQSSTSHRRDFYGQDVVVPQPQQVYQPNRYSFQQQQQDRLAPPQQRAPFTNVEPPTFFPTQRRVPSAQSEVSFTGPSSRTRFETPVGRKLSSQTDSFNSFPRAPEIPQPVEDNIYDPRDFSQRVRASTERSTTARQPSGLRRFKPGTRSQAGSKNNVLTLNKNVEDPTSTPRAQRVRPSATGAGADTRGSRYRTIPSRFKVRPSASEEPPYEEPSTTSSTASPLDYSRDYHPVVSYVENSTPPLAVPSVEYEFGNIPETDFSSPSGPSAPSGPSDAQDQQPASPDYAQYDYEVSEPNQPSDTDAPSAPQKNETYEVITMKPEHSLVADENFDGFVDSTLIDNTPAAKPHPEETSTEASSVGVSVSVHTAVSTVPKPTTPIPEVVETQSKTNLEVPPTSEPEVNVTNSTESWVVVASVQTSRSVSGARFIPFHTGIKQEERVLPSLQSNKLESTTTSTSTTEQVTQPIKQEEPKSSSTTTTTTTTTTTSEPPLFERKFSPSTRPPKTKSRIPQSLLESIQFDDLGPGLLPPGFKPRQGQSSFRSNRPVTTSTTEATSVSTSAPSTTTTTTEATKAALKFDEIDPALLPPGFKFSPNIAPPVEDTETTTRASSGFRPKSKANATATSLRPFSGKALNATTKNNNVAPVVKHKTSEEIFASLLPPGYKTESAKPKEEIVASLLPPGFKPEAPVKVDSTSALLSEILSKAKPIDVSALLPPGFKPAEAATPSTTAAPPAPTKSQGFHVPKPGSGTRKPFGGFRFTTPHPNEENGGSGGDGGHHVEQTLSTPKIQKGWPTRATTEFTGWPTPPTTPLSAEKILELASRTTTTTTTTTTEATTTTTTTTTTTPRPTTPGVCTDECQLAGTIRLTDGVHWVPELMDRNTAEYKALAANITAELKSVYQKSDALNKLFRNVWIDGFNKGSVLVDYIVQLETQAKQYDTQQLKNMFHDSLGHPYQRSVASEAEDAANENDISRPKALQLGRFEIDPDFTDFIVLPPTAEPTPLPTQEDEFLPQWAIAVIVIGLASLLFVIIFGVSVLISNKPFQSKTLINRQQAQQSKQPVILSDAMLNELGKDHMGGYDNMAVDDIYGLDGWETAPRNHEPKYSSKRGHGKAHGNGGMGYDSWRSDWNGYYYGGSANGGYVSKGPGSHSSGGGRRSRMPDYDTNF